jgi:hypothetical protein
MWSDLQTMKETYQEIARGERPWNALGDFTNYFFCYASDRREDLIKDPIEEPAEMTPELHQWAVFCAASVEYLCQKYNLSCPDWVKKPTYILLEPWFKGLGAQKLHVQERLKQETPEPFTKRNIFCGDRIFANKYELAANIHERQTACV